MSDYIGKSLVKDEQIVQRAKIHWAILVPHAFLMLFVIGFITIWGAIVAKLTTELGITNKKVIGKTGWISTRQLDSPLSKINNVSVSNGLFGKLFNYVTIYITTSSGGYLFKGVARPNDFRANLLDQIERFDNDRIRKQALEIASAMK